MWDDELAVPTMGGAGKSGTRRIAPRVLAHGLLWGMLLLLLAVGVPRLEAVFVDFGIPVSKLAMLAIAASHIVLAVAPITMLAFVGLIAADWAVLADLSRRGEVRVSRAWSTLMVATPLLAIAATLLGLTLVLNQLLSALRG